MSALTTPALSYQVSPLVMEIIGEPGAQQLIRIENTKSIPITIEISILRRYINDDGTEELVPAEEDFIVLPPQSIIQPGKVQNVRLQYLGDPLTDETTHYRVVVDQLPVKFKQSQTGSSAQFVLKYELAAHLAPRAAVEEAVKTEVTSTGDGKLAISLRNEGLKYVLLSRKDYKFSSSSGDTVVTGFDHFLNAVGVNVLPASGSRSVIVDVPEGLDVSAGVTLEIIDKQNKRKSKEQ
ncbi:MAG: fimbria/pilus periplasmic chaperone [Pseudomonadota bacterium]